MDKSITVIGLDLAKSVFQVHGINAKGEVVALLHVQNSKNRVASLRESMMVYVGSLVWLATETQSR